MNQTPSGTTALGRDPEPVRSGQTAARAAAASVGSCPPLLDVQWTVRSCAAFNEEVVKFVERQGIELVVLSGMWVKLRRGHQLQTRAWG